MKTKILSNMILTVASLVIASTSFNYLQAQGSLTPSSGPAETMKSLDEIEPRTPISSLPFSIDEPGSYYITSNLQSTGSGITINSYDVTLDLMGYTIYGQGYDSPQSEEGITISNYPNVVIRNGNIANFYTGVELRGVTNASLEDLCISENRSAGVQIVSSFDVTITNCKINANRDNGIATLGSYGDTILNKNIKIQNCHVFDNIGHGIYLSASQGTAISNCIVSHTIRKSADDGAGICLQAGNLACDGNTVTECVIVNNYRYGVLLTGSTIEPERGSGNVVNDCVIRGSQFGIYGSFIAGNRFENNHISKTSEGSSIGIWTTNSNNNQIVHNTVYGYDTDFLLDAEDSLVEWSSNADSRTPIDSLPFTISSSGSYFITQNLTAGAGENGITVNASNVTIDLNGFTLTGSGADSGNGIEQPSTYHNLTVTNGTFINWAGAAKYGIHSLGSGTHLQSIKANHCYNGVYTDIGAKIEDCSATGNSSNGLRAGYGSTLNNCSVTNNLGGASISTQNDSFVMNCNVSNCTGSYGIFVGTGSLVSSCVVTNNELDKGIYASYSSTITDCTASYNTGSDTLSCGIHASPGSSVLNCTAGNNKHSSGTGASQGIGIYGTGIQVVNCTVGYNSGDGIQVGIDSLLSHNQCRANGRNAGDGAGIHVTGDNNRIEENHMSQNDRGLDVDDKNNIIVKNTSVSNTSDYAVAAGNDYTVSASPISANPWDNF